MRTITTLLLGIQCLAPAAAQRSIVIYEGRFSGAEATVHGNWNAVGPNAIWNDRIGSIRVPDGQRVILYEDIGFQGRSIEIDLLSGNLIPEVKHTEDGGNDAWDTDSYMNIWVCHIQPITIGPIVLGQILGFAFPPNNLGNWPPDSGAPNPAEDGVVIDYRVFGPDNPYPLEIPGGTGNLVVKGRTPTHEVAHYLGLRHIWGDGGTFGPNDCDQSDGVDDTPFASSESAFDCDITKNTCTGIDDFYGLDMPDLVENYMDYASEDCMNMFTKGQVEIMRNVLTGPRSGLLETTAVLSPESERLTWTISPNPAADLITIRSAKPFDASAILRVHDGLGRPVHHQSLQDGGEMVNISVMDWPSGVYTLVLSEDSNSSTQKLIIHR